MKEEEAEEAEEAEKREEWWYELKWSGVFLFHWYAMLDINIIQYNYIYIEIRMTYSQEFSFL